MSEPSSYGSTSPADAPPPEVNRRRGRKVWAIISVSLAVALIATGAFLFQRHRADVAEAHRQQVAHQKELARERREAAKLAKEQREAAAAAQRAAAEYDGCVDEVSPFMDDLSTVDARLDVGVQESEFSDFVGQASVSYNRIDPDKLQGGCLSAAAMLETALQKYIGTASNGMTVCGTATTAPPMTSNRRCSAAGLGRRRSSIGHRRISTLQIVQR